MYSLIFFMKEGAHKSHDTALSVSLKMSYKGNTKHFKIFHLYSPPGNSQLKAHRSLAIN